MEEDSEQTPENRYSKVPPQLRKYVFKTGNNAGGRTKGSKSLKTYAREYLEGMTEEERVEYLNSLNPDFVWRMAEGQPDTKLKGDSDEPIVLIVKNVNGNSPTKELRVEGIPDGTPPSSPTI